VTNSAGSVTSSPAATLTVNIPPSITTGPGSQSAIAGNTVSFSVVAAGTAPFSYQWQAAGIGAYTNLINGPQISGATSNVLTLTGVTTNWALNYVVIVGNSYGSVTSSPPATLTVNVPPSITTEPVSQSAIAGNTVSFSVVAAGTAPLSYQWQAGSGGAYTNLVNGGNVSGSSSNVLTLTGVTTNWALNYVVIVGNGYGSVTSSPAATLTVNIPPSITTEPASQSAIAGSTVLFSVGATGTAPLSYQWQAGSGGGYTNLFDGGTVSGSTSNVLTLTGVTTNWALNYVVMVSNSAGAVTSTPAATLTVTVPPAITNQPASQTNSVGGTASFSVGATGTAPLSYQWQAGLGGAYTNLVDGPQASGSVSNVLTIANLTTNWALAFQVIVANIAGSITSTPPATLTVTSAPVAPTLGLQPNGQGGFVLTWSSGSLLQATSVFGPWTTNSAATSPFTNTPDPGTPQMFYRVQAQ
jgi:hypothetical protein